MSCIVVVSNVPLSTPVEGPILCVPYADGGGTACGTSLSVTLDPASNITTEEVHSIETETSASDTCRGRIINTSI